MSKRSDRTHLKLVPTDDSAQRDAAQIKAVGRLVREKRLAASITQVQLSQAIQISQSTLSKVETGQLELGFGDFLRASRALGMKPEEFIAKVESGTGTRGRKRRAA